MFQKRNLGLSTTRAIPITCEHQPSTAAESRRRWRSFIRCTVWSVLFFSFLLYSRNHYSTFSYLSYTSIVSPYTILPIRPLLQAPPPLHYPLIVNPPPVSAEHDPPIHLHLLLHLSPPGVQNFPGYPARAHRPLHRNPAAVPHVHRRRHPHAHQSRPERPHGRQRRLLHPPQVPPLVETDGLDGPKRSQGGGIVVV